MAPRCHEPAIGASKATHLTGAQPRTFRRGGAITTLIPATLPLAEIVDRLNELQPLVLLGYPSILDALAHEAAAAARLRVSSRMVGPHAEPLLPEMRAAMEEAWRCTVMNGYGTSEGVSAGACGAGRGMHLSEDVAIFEFVDNDGNAVPPGVRASKMYITNLYNDVQPDDRSGPRRRDHWCVGRADRDDRGRWVADPWLLWRRGTGD